MAVQGVEGVIALAAGANHTCALSNTSAVLTLVEVSGLSGSPEAVVKITAGGFHACALSSTGTVKCWGRHSYGQLGNDTTTGSSVPVVVSGLVDVLSISAGASHTCAVIAEWGAVCWGYNQTGQLGDGSNTHRLVPVAVVGLPGGVSTIAASGSHTCAVTVAGSVKCWGGNTYGQLGDGTTTDQWTGVQTSGLRSASFPVVTLSAISVTSGERVQLTAGVAGASTETVQFFVDGLSLGEPATLVDGTATLETTLAAGLHRIQVRYSGSSDLLPGVSAGAMLRVLP